MESTARASSRVVGDHQGRRCGERCQHVAAGLLSQKFEHALSAEQPRRAQSLPVQALVEEYGPAELEREGCHQTGWGARQAMMGGGCLAKPADSARQSIEEAAMKCGPDTTRWICTCTPAEEHFIDKGSSRACMQLGVNAESLGGGTTCQWWCWPVRWGCISSVSSDKQILSSHTRFADVAQVEVFDAKQAGASQTLNCM
ncbi:MAG: hypothetical protein FRX49_07485 [Trebouxia sp. A1-2]|nr:MAG: hypothetical protein FRX49_07485 [Trebouxia sp. A1-2]